MNKKKSIVELRIDFRKNYKEVYDFLMDLDERGDNAFMQSLYNQFMRYGTLSLKQRESAMNAKQYLINMEKREELKEVHKDDEPMGSYVGTLKTRYDMVLKFISVRDTSRGFWVQTFQDKTGNQLMTFSDTRNILLDGLSPQTITEGDCFTCRATVNRHSVNDFDPLNKVKQTVINRIKYNKYLGRKSDDTV